MSLRASNSGPSVLKDGNQVTAICGSGWADYREDEFTKELVTSIRTEGEKLDSLMRTDFF